MSFNLDQIDELRKRANVSYEDAKDALEKCNGDLVEALIYLEKQNKVKPEQEAKQKCRFFTKIKNLIKRGNNIKFIIKKGEKIVLSIPLTLAVLVTLFAPHVVVIGLLLILLTGHRIKFEGKSGEDMKVNETMDKISTAVNTVKKKLIDEDVNETSALNQ